MTGADARVGPVVHPLGTCNHSAAANGDWIATGRMATASRISMIFDGCAIGRRRFSVLHDIDHPAYHPYIDLVEASFQDFLILKKEAMVIARVGNINEQSLCFIHEDASAITPKTLNVLRVGAHRPEAFSQFRLTFPEKTSGNQAPVIKLPRQ